MNFRKSVFAVMASFIAGTAMGIGALSEQVSPAIGLQAGINFESAKNPSQISTSSHTGFTVGLQAQVPIAANLALQPEISYSRRGINIVEGGGFESDVYYHSIEVPVLVRVSLGEAIRPYAFFGPMAVYNISREVTATVGDSTASNSFNPKTIDLAAVAGIGVDFGAYFVNARYSMGIIDANENVAEYYSRGFKLLVGMDI